MSSNILYQINVQDVSSIKNKYQKSCILTFTNRKRWQIRTLDLSTGLKIDCNLYIKNASNPTISTDTIHIQVAPNLIVEAVRNVHRGMDIYLSEHSICFVGAARNRGIIIKQMVPIRIVEEEQPSSNYLVSEPIVQIYMPSFQIVKTAIEQLKKINSKCITLSANMEGQLEFQTIHDLGKVKMAFSNLTNPNKDFTKDSMITLIVYFEENEDNEESIFTFHFPTLKE
ncbi:hypothetical protein O9G_001183 [Rozella allomycis CSF55]|uniref:Checkpoint protein n=1 Tax=Rozella allomycis (strain CSF55) TaxID=988480 RepID=A0A075AXF4_ROZAC|nr:hypothetical protein O9G_001183 [Rozella allomycis CSF55]|eukprot:EPZ33214.1 hypothetical protein O9G_001183 [Rozella allomycis CSF55]